MSNLKMPIPVAWRWPYQFKDIGETGAYEHHSHDFAVLAHMPKGEPLYTADALRDVLEQAIDLVAFHGGSVEIEAAIRAMKDSI